VKCGLELVPRHRAGIRRQGWWKDLAAKIKCPIAQLRCRFQSIGRSIGRKPYRSLRCRERTINVAGFKQGLGISIKRAWCFATQGELLAHYLRRLGPTLRFPQTVDQPGYRIRA
jgi:hypothetical protein